MCRINVLKGCKFCHHLLTIASFQPCVKVIRAWNDYPYPLNLLFILSYEKQSGQTIKTFSLQRQNKRNKVETCCSFAKKICMLLKPCIIKACKMNFLQTNQTIFCNHLISLTFHTSYFREPWKHREASDEAHSSSCSHKRTHLHFSPFHSSNLISQ